MLRTSLAAGAAVLLLGPALPAHAADNGIYIGGSIGQANVEQIDELSGFDLDDDDTAWKAIVGIRPLDFLGFELSYVDFGNVEDTVGPTRFGAQATGLNAFAVGFFGLPFMDLFAKAGVISWDADLSVDGVKTLGDDGTDFAWGVGAQVRFGSAAVRAEYEKFEIGDFDDVNMISIGFTWTFL